MMLGFAHKRRESENGQNRAFCASPMPFMKAGRRWKWRPLALCLSTMEFETDLMLGKGRASEAGEQ
jgi:hypothetical protein